MIRGRRRTLIIPVALISILVLVGGMLTAAVRFGGYCGADFLPLDENLEAAPYVQNVTATSATIMWRTSSESEGVVAYGASPSMEHIAPSDRARNHAVTLTDLASGTEYFYEVRGSETTFDPRSFRTAPGPEGAVTAAIVGDTGTGEPAQYDVADIMLAMEPDLILHTGDVVYRRGGECHYDEKFYDPYETLIASVPVYPVLGNHDVLTDNGEPFLEAFDLPASGSGTERFYSFDYGPLHIAALNSELYYGDESIPPDEQIAWLRQDLAATDRPWTIVIVHRPPFNSTPYHGADPNILRDFVEIFAEYGVDIVFAGHEHVYERLQPVDGVTYIVTGGGGGNLRGAGTSEQTVVSALRHHAISLNATPERLCVTAIGTGGEVFDSFELTHDPESSAAAAASPPNVEPRC